MTAAALPRDLIVRVLTDLVGDPKDIVSSSVACRSWLAAATEPSLWREAAHHRFGPDVAEATVKLYGGDWRATLADDGRRGALPTFWGPWPSHWRYNTPNGYYCCLVLCAKWHRPSGKVRVYIDARGESDLRHPMGSSVSSPHGNWRPEIWVGSVNARRHFKGYLVFAEHIFRDGGTFEFCYANAGPSLEHADYESVLFLSVPPPPGGGGLRAARAAPPGLALLGGIEAPSSGFTLDLSPFQNDTPDVERQRWGNVVDRAILVRHLNSGGRVEEWLSDGPPQEENDRAGFFGWLHGMEIGWLQEMELRRFVEPITDEAEADADAVAISVVRDIGFIRTARED